MPSKIISGFKFQFYSSDRIEPLHIHVHQTRQAKIKLNIENIPNRVHPKTSMKYLNVQEVNPSFAAIVNEVSVSQSEIVITRNGIPLARIIPYTPTRIKHYPLRGMPITISADFDEPMSDLWEALNE